MNKATAEICYKKWHYLGATKFLSNFNFGVYYDRELWGCISYGSPNAKELKGYFSRDTQKGYYEIKRLALSDDLPKNSESRVIAISIRLLRKRRLVKGIITYADSGVGHSGIIYRASGFKYLGLTAPKKDFYEEGSSKPKQRGEVKNLKGQWKPRSRKHLFIKLFPDNTLPPDSRRVVGSHPKMELLSKIEKLKVAGTAPAA